MRKLTGAIALVSLLAWTPLGVLAQQTQPREPGPRSPAERPAGAQDRQQDRQQQDRPVWQNSEGAVEIRQIVGTRVRGADGRNVGEIDQVLVDPKSGKISHAVIGMGGFAGVGERKVVVPWSAVTLSQDQPADQRGGPTLGRRTQRMVAQIDQAELDRAPRYEGTTASRDRQERTPAASPPGPKDTAR